MIDPKLLEVFDSPYVHDKSDKIGGGYTVDEDAPQEVIDALTKYEEAMKLIRSSRNFEE